MVSREQGLITVAVVALVVLSAVLSPAALIGDSGEKDNITTIEGERYEYDDASGPSTDGLNSLNALPSSYTDRGEDAPAPPDQVRASAGSQTMSVETAVVDGEPAIVLEDDRTHDGRWVSIDTAWFQEHVGEIPSAAYIAHEDGTEYAAPLNVRGDSAAFYVREFSTNTVTFDGEVRLSGSQAGDGSQFQYELANTTGINDPAINLTGVENTEAASTSISATGSDTLPIDVGGTAAPRDETVTLTGVEETSAGSLSLGPVSDGYSTTVDVGGNQPTRNAEVTLTGQSTDDQQSYSGTLSPGESRSISVDGNAPTDGSVSVNFKTRSTTTGGGYSDFLDPLTS